MAIENTHYRRDGILPIEERVITDVRRAEDGWDVEVEDPQGRRLRYWLAGWQCIPRLGDRARFHGGVDGRPLRNVEINGRSVYAD